MLSFVLGQSGTGKTEYLYDTFCELAKKGENKLLFIVPDQCSFETEKVFLDRLGPMLCQNVLVLGFSRLCDYVFEKEGMLFSSFADEGLRHVVMSLAIDEVSDSLSLFASRAMSYDLTELMLTAVKEYKKCSITTDMLRTASEKCGDEILSKKLYETALVYDTYTALIENSYIDPLDSLTKVSNILNNSTMFDGYTIAVDSFYGFTHQEYDVLGALISHCKDIYFSLTTDNLNGENGDLFFVCDRTRKRLKRIADSCSVKVAPYIKLTENKRVHSNSLNTLQNGIFRIERDVQDNSENVNVYVANSIFDEADFVARTIAKLVMDENYRFGDIAVVSREPDKYIGILDTSFEKYNINYFMDKPQDIDSKPIVRFCNCAFDIITGGFDKDDVLSLLKTGLTSYSFEEIAEFENYLFVWDISGKMFFDEFVNNPRGFVDEFTNNDTEVLERVEKMRKDIISALAKFKSGCSDATGKEISKALMNLIYSLKCKENIEKLCDIYEKNDDIVLSQELVRMYNLLCEILDKMVYVIGDYNISAKRYGELLHTYFSNIEISFIPKGIDEVDVASADRANLGNKKAVFVIGCNEGEFPRNPVEAGVFTDNERKALMELNLSVSDSIEELSKTERFLAYKAISSASDILFVSGYENTIKGERITQSEIIAEISSILPNVETLSNDDTILKDRLYSEEAAFEYLCDKYNSSDGYLSELKEYFLENEKYSELLKTIDNLYEKKKKKISRKELTKALFSNDMRLSASQIEKYHKCKFQYFCYYGLNVKERTKASMDALEYGTMMHSLLQHFFEKHKDNDFTSITDIEINDTVKELLERYFSKHFGLESDKTSRFMYLYKRVEKIATKLIKRICDEFSQCEFTPSDFELSIGDDIPAYTVKVDEDLSVSVHGSIDRVDVLHKDGENYVRVVDYKTGKKEFSLSDIMYGINLQMLIYMSALNRNSQEYFKEKMTPAGVLYMPAVSPKFSAERSETEEEIKSKNSAKYCMQGIVLDDVNVIKSMEKDVKGIYIPVVISDDKVKKGKNCLATLEEMGALFKKVDLLISQMAQTLSDGMIEENPTKEKGKTACDWCPYMSVCSHTDDDDFREVKSMKKDDMFEQIFEEVGRYE